MGPVSSSLMFLTNLTTNISISDNIVPAFHFNSVQPLDLLLRNSKKVS